MKIDSVGLKLKIAMRMNGRKITAYSWFAINLSGCAGQCQPPTPAGSDNAPNNILFCCVVPPTWPPWRQMQTINTECIKFVGCRPLTVKAVFHFNRIVPKRSVLYCVHIISSARVFMKQWNTLRFATIWLKWKTALKV